MKSELSLLSSSNVQVDASQNSHYSEFDKFVWKAEILSLAEITSLQHVIYYLFLMSIYIFCWKQTELYAFSAYIGDNLCYCCYVRKIWSWPDRLVLWWMCVAPGIFIQVQARRWRKTNNRVATSIIYPKERERKTLRKPTKGNLMVSQPRDG